MMESNLSYISLQQDEYRLSRYRKEYTLLFIWSINAVSISKIRRTGSLLPYISLSDLSYVSEKKLPHLAALRTTAFCSLDGTCNRSGADL